jgi:flagellar motor switch protein FliN
MENPDIRSLDTHGGARLVLNQWTESLAQVLESMAEKRPRVEWQPGAGALAQFIGAGEGTWLWWEQPFRGPSEMIAWVAAPRAVWEYVGGITLQAAGVETVAEAETRNTWLEILGQSLGGLATSLGGVLGREVTCAAGVERGPDLQLTGWATVKLQFSEPDLPALAIVFAPGLLTALAPRAPAESRGEEGEGGSGDKQTPASPVGARTLDLLMEVDLPVSISFGRAQIPLKDVLKLTTGSIVELNRGVNDQVEVLVNHCLLARGEVVVVEGNYGVRIQEIASRQDRLRSLR